jgi:hypothetical protein
MTTKAQNRDRAYKYTSVRMAKRTSVILREVAKRNHWTLKQACDKVVLEYAELLDYLNSL